MELLPVLTGDRRKLEQLQDYRDRLEYAVFVHNVVGEEPDILRTKLAGANRDIAKFIQETSEPSPPAPGSTPDDHAGAIPARGTKAT